MRSQREKWGGWSLLIALLLVLSLFATTATQTVFAETVVYQCPSSMDDQKVVDGGQTYTVYCVNEGRAYKDSANSTYSNQRVKYIWDSALDTTEFPTYNFSRALALALNENRFDTNGRRSDWPGTHEFTPDDVVNSSDCADLLAKVLYYGEKGNYSKGDIQTAVYWAVYSGKNNTSSDNKLVQEALTGTVPQNYKLYVYLPSEAAFEAEGYPAWDQSVIRGEFEPKEDDNSKIEITTTVKTSTIEAKANQTIIDTVEYKGLTAKEEYTLTGKLMDKKTGKEVTATYDATPVTFTPDSADGTQDVEFTIDASGFSDGDQIVVFETLTDKDGNVVARHEEMDSAAQTVTVKEDPVDEGEDTGDSSGGNKGDTDDNGGVGSGSSGGVGTGDENGSKGKAVKTGDEAPFALAGVLLLGAAAALLASRKQRNH